MQNDVTDRNISCSVGVLTNSSPNRFKLTPAVINILRSELQKISCKQYQRIFFFILALFHCRTAKGLYDFQVTNRNERGFSSCSSHSRRLQPLTHSRLSENPRGAIGKLPIPTAWRADYGGGGGWAPGRGLE
jgi:hypothetical protein